MGMNTEDEFETDLPERGSDEPRQGLDAHRVIGAGGHGLLSAPSAVDRTEKDVGDSGHRDREQCAEDAGKLSADQERSHRNQRMEACDPSVHAGSE